MADTRVRIRHWGRDYAQLQAEIALIEAEYADATSIDEQFLCMLAIDRARDDFRRRTRSADPPHWE